MRIFIIIRSDADDTCDVIETARLTREEADAYVAEQAEHYKAQGYRTDDWHIEAIDMPLTLDSPRIMAEAVTSG